MDSTPMMLQRTLALDGGARVRLRLARPRDYRPLTQLLGAARAGEGIDAAALVRFDPRSAAVICACALDDGRERLVGVGSIDFSSEAREVVVVEPGFDAGLEELVTEALRGRAGAHVANHGT